MNHFNSPSAGLPQRQCGVDTEICHFSLPNRKFSVGLTEGWLGWGSDGCCTDDGQRLLLKRKSVLGENLKLEKDNLAFFFFAHNIYPSKVRRVSFKVIHEHTFKPAISNCMGVVVRGWVNFYRSCNIFYSLICAQADVASVEQIALLHVIQAQSNLLSVWDALHIQALFFSFTSVTFVD